MIGIILLILKIIGIILLSIIALILFIVLLLLLLPMKYYFIGSKKDNFEIDTKFTWLFSIISVQYILKDGSDDLKVRIPFLNKIMAEDEPKEKNNKKAKSSKKSMVSTPSDNDLQTDMSLSVHNVSNIDNENENEAGKSNKNKFIDKQYLIRKKLKDFFENIRELLGKAKKYKPEAKAFDKEFNIKKVLKISWKFFVKLLKALRLKKFEVNGKIGFDSPADTGIALGAASMIIPFLPGNINIEGDFNNRIFTGNVFIKGRTNLLFILIPVIKYILTKPILAIIKKYWR